MKIARRWQQIPASAIPRAQELGLLISDRWATGGILQHFVLATPDEHEAILAEHYAALEELLAQTL